jgi:cell wall assembly regulator SMI1
MRHTIDPGFSISLGQLQAWENFAAHYKAWRSVLDRADQASDFELSQAQCEADDAAREAVEACRQVRGMGS